MAASAKRANEGEAAGLSPPRKRRKLTAASFSDAIPSLEESARQNKNAVLEERLRQQESGNGQRLRVHVTRENDLRFVYVHYLVLDLHSLLEYRTDTRSLYVSGLLLTGNITKSQEIQV